MTSSNENIFRITGPLCGELTGHRGSPDIFVIIPCTSELIDNNSLYMLAFASQWRGALIFFFDLRLNKRLSKQSWGWWLKTPLCPLWRRCNVYGVWWCMPYVGKELGCDGLLSEVTLQAITWINDDLSSVRSCGTHLRVFHRKFVRYSRLYTSLKITDIK